MRTGYLHCIGGASGDMLLGALIDAGLSVEALNGEIAKLPIEECSVKAAIAQRGVISGTHVTVETGGGRETSHSIHDFIAMIDGSALTTSVKESSTRVLERLEEAETRVHGDEHRLQELGDMDTIIDVAGVVAGLELLGIEKLYSSPLPAGWGVISTRKGALPVPAPATAQLIAMSRAKVAPPRGPYLSAGELVTPTGAALITTLASFDAPPMSLERMGYGVGTRDNPDIPNVLALWIGETEDIAPSAQVSLLETNIDDMSPEMMGYVQEELMRQGALDAWFSPIQMKKNRPAVTLSVLCRPAMETALVKTILQETSTLGVRVQAMNRYEAEREVVSVNTSFGLVRVKLKKDAGTILSVSPEYEDCREIALRNGMPLQEVFRMVERDARAALGVE